MGNVDYRIAYLLNSSQIGGGNRSLMTLWKGLKGYPVTPVVVCPQTGPMVEIVTQMGIDSSIHQYFQPSWKSIIKTHRYKKKWQNFLAGSGISMIHANDPISARVAIQAAHAEGLPVVCHVRFSLSKEFSRWVFRGLRKPFGFIFNSNAIKSEVGPDLDNACPRAKQWVVYNGVDLEQFKADWSYKSGQIRIGIVANLHPVKGHEDFVSMAKILLDRDYDIHFDIIGDDIHRTSRMTALKEMVTALGIERRVLFHGFVDNVAEVIKDIDIIVCPSHIESFGRCIIEAMACGKPVVATKVGGIPEIVVDNDTGILVPPKSPGELADAVRRLLANPTCRAEMGRKGRDRVELLFSMEAHAKAIADIYGQILECKWRAFTEMPH